MPSKSSSWAARQLRAERARALQDQRAQRKRESWERMVAAVAAKYAPRPDGGA